MGPATTVDVHCNVPPRVEVRTEGEAASELGRRLARLVLTPQQLGLMKWAPSRVCITGPSGTGKTLMLVLIGIRWLRQDRDVHVVSTFPGSLAASRVIRHQLKMTVAVSSSSSEYTPPQSSSAAVPAGTVRFHAYDLYDSEADVDRALADLLEAVRGGRLCVLVDEAKFTNRLVWYWSFNRAGMGRGGGRGAGGRKCACVCHLRKCAACFVKKRKKKKKRKK